MRTSLSLAVLLLCSLSVFASDVSEGRWHVSILASEISTSNHVSFAGFDGWSDESIRAWGWAFRTQ